MTREIDKKKSIGAIAKEIGVETHVIRFWENKFPQIKPEIGKGKRRYYFAKDIEVLKKIRSLLYDEGYTITGLQNLLKKRKKSDSKEQNLQFLLEGEAVHNDKDINDFINPQIVIRGTIDEDEKSAINKAINKLEINLDKLQKLISG